MLPPQSGDEKHESEPVDKKKENLHDTTQRKTSLSDKRHTVASGSLDLPSRSSLQNRTRRRHRAGRRRRSGGTRRGRLTLGRRGRSHGRHRRHGGQGRRHGRRGRRHGRPGRRHRRRPTSRRVAHRHQRTRTEERLRGRGPARSHSSRRGAWPWPALLAVAVSIRWVEVSRFDTVDRDYVLAAAEVERQRLVRASDDSERAVVAAGERRLRGVTAQEHVCGVLKSARDASR